MRILVIRLSAMGDVALTLPPLRAFREKYPDYELLVLTRPAFAAFFGDGSGIKLLAADLKGRHKGFSGIWILYRDIKKEGKIDFVIDLHNVIRSRILGGLLRLSGTPVYIIDKGRKEKRALVKGLIRQPLKHTAERYAEVFGRAGFSISPVKGRCITPGERAVSKAGELLAGYRGLNIGIAPFARHELKQWPAERMLELMRMISGRVTARFWLFGGIEERDRLAAMEKAGRGITSTCGRLKLDEELALMGKLDFMIAMDSSNMHMAALAGARVISIWGGTDPKAGFGAWGQPPEYSVYISSEELDCRPCTIYGKGSCRRGDFACMIRLTPEMVFKRLVELGFI